MNLSIHPNALYYGDCLEIMRNFPDEYVDLICTAPDLHKKDARNPNNLLKLNASEKIIEFT